MLGILHLFDNKFDTKIFSDVDFKFVKDFDIFLQCPQKTKYEGNRTVRRKGRCGNTRKYYHMALRAIYNKAIQINEADDRFYPYGNGKFEISKLEEITAKRYLANADIEKIYTFHNLESVY
jgi:hypothetical protein